MGSALVALGGNIGDVRAAFRQAIPEVLARASATLVARSSDYRTPPWGYAQQSPFINACIAIETAAEPLALLRVLLEVERIHGRDRAREQRWGPRALDLDLIAYDNLRMKTNELELPHPRLFQRAFVLVPLAEVAPNRLISGVSPVQALKMVSANGIQRLPAEP